MDNIEIGELIDVLFGLRKNYGPETKIAIKDSKISIVTELIVYDKNCTIEPCA